MVSDSQPWVSDTNIMILNTNDIETPHLFTIIAYLGELFILLIPGVGTNTYISPVEYE